MLEEVSKMDLAWPVKCHDMQGDPVFHVKWMHLVKIKITTNFIGENFIGNTHLLGSTVFSIIIFVTQNLYLYLYDQPYICKKTSWANNGTVFLILQERKAIILKHE